MDAMLFLVLYVAVLEVVARWLDRKRKGERRA